MFPCIFLVSVLTPHYRLMSDDLDLRVADESGHVVLVPLGVGCFIQYILFQLHLFTCRFYLLIYFPTGIVFPCLSVLYLHLVCFHFMTIVNSVAMKMVRQISVV